VRVPADSGEALQPPPHPAILCASLPVSVGRARRPQLTQLIGCYIIATNELLLVEASSQWIGPLH
jgi:hypothetical protein